MPGHQLDDSCNNTEPHLQKTYLYRLCRPDEDPSKGLEARDPNAQGVSISSHLRGKRRSPYISTTATIECVQMFIGSAIMEGSKPGKVVRIDLDKLKQEPQIEIIDLNNPDVIQKSLAKVDAKGRANIVKYKEVLLKGRIPSDCIEVLEDVEIPEQHETDDYTSSDEEYQGHDQEHINASPRQDALLDRGNATIIGIVNGLNGCNHDLTITRLPQDLGELKLIDTLRTSVKDHHTESPVIDNILKKAESKSIDRESPMQDDLANSEDKSYGLGEGYNPIEKNDHPVEEKQNDEDGQKWEVRASKEDKHDILGAVCQIDVNELFKAGEANSDEGSDIEIVDEEETQEKSGVISEGAVQLSSCDDFEKDKASKKLEILTEKYKNSLEAFITRRESTLQVLRELVDQLNDCRTRGNITKISGASVSIAGAIAAVASIPLTGGLSAVALTAGSLFSIGGGIAGIGGEVYVNTCEKDYMKRANFVLKCDQEEAERLDQAGYELKSHVSHMSKIGVPEVQIFRIMTTAYTNTMVVFRLLEVSETIAKIGKVTKHAASGLAKAGHLAKGAGAFVSVVFVPLDIWQIVNSSWELNNDNSEKAQLIENVINDLEKDLAEKKSFLHKGVDSKDNSKDEKDIDSKDGKDDDLKTKQVVYLDDVRATEPKDELVIDPKEEKGNSSIEEIATNLNDWNGFDSTNEKRYGGNNDKCETTEDI